MESPIVQAQQESDWQRINRLPADLRKMTLMSFDLITLATAYSSNLPNIRKILSELDFWLVRLQRAGFLSTREPHDAWLKVWVGTPRADEMISHLAIQSKEPYSYSIHCLRYFQKAFKRSPPFPGLELGEDANFLMENLTIANENFENSKQDLGRMMVTQADIEWVQSFYLERTRKREKNQPEYLYHELRLPEDAKVGTTLSYADYIKMFEKVPVTDQNFSSMVLFMLLKYDFIDNLETVTDDNHDEWNPTLKSLRILRRYTLNRLELLGKNLRQYDYGTFRSDNGKARRYIITMDKNGQPLFNLASAAHNVEPTIVLDVLKKHNIHREEDLQKLGLYFGHIWIDNREFQMTWLNQGQDYIFDGYKLHGNFV